MGAASMSLVRTRWIAIAGAAATAVAVPTWALRETPVAIEGVAPIVVTMLPAIETPSLDIAAVAPPFSPTRSDVVEAAGAVPPAADLGATAAPTPAAEPPRLVGTVVAPRGRAVALFKDASGQTVMAGVGEAVGGWTIARITASRVDLSKAGERRSVALDYGNRQPSPGAAPTTEPPQ